MRKVRPDHIDNRGLIPCIHASHEDDQHSAFGYDLDYVPIESIQTVAREGSDA